MDLTRDQHDAILRFETFQQLAKNMRTMFGWLIAIGVNKALQVTIVGSHTAADIAAGAAGAAKPGYYWLFFLATFGVFACVFVPLRNWFMETVPQV